MLCVCFCAHSSTSIRTRFAVVASVYVVCRMYLRYANYEFIRVVFQVVAAGCDATLEAFKDPTLCGGYKSPHKLFNAIL